MALLPSPARAMPVRRRRDGRLDEIPGKSGPRSASPLGLRQRREMARGRFDPSPPIGAPLMLDGERSDRARMFDDLVDSVTAQRAALNDGPDQRQNDIQVFR
jgi:hypothetical protein